MANALGIDLGGIYRTVEATKGARQDRELALKREGRDEVTFQRQGEAHNLNMAATRANMSAATSAAERDAAARGAAARYAGGDKGALPELISLNPQMATQILDAFSKLDEAGRKAKLQEVEVLGRTAAGILQAPDPKAAYAQLLSSIPEAERSKFPAEYDENFVRAQLAKAVEVDKLYETITKEQTTATEHSNAMALEGQKSANKIAEELAKAGGGQIESADASLIFRQSAELLGGVFDQAGNLQTLDPNSRAKAQEIATRASQYFVKGATHAQAVKQAAQELGIQFPGAAPAAGSPAGPPGSNAFAPAAAPAAPANPADPMGIL